MARTFLHLLIFYFSTVIAFLKYLDNRLDAVSGAEIEGSQEYPAPVGLDRFSAPADILVRSIKTIRREVADEGTNTQPRNFHPDDGALVLHSSLSNLSSVEGYNLYSAPILTAQYRDILTATRDDLSRHHDVHGYTKFYQYKYSGWSFEVVVANGTLHYASLNAILTRYLKLIPTYGPATHFTRTRVGRLDRDRHPIADIALVPLDVQPRPESTAKAIQLEPGEVLVTDITPHGGKSHAVRFTGQELSIFGKPTITTVPKRQTSLEQEVVLQVAKSAFAVSVQIWRDPSLNLVAVSILILISVMLTALSQMALTLAAQITHGEAAGLLVGDKWDSGYLRVGRLCARFIMRIHRALTYAEGMSIIRTILSPLRAQGSEKKKMYALRGNVYERSDASANDGTQEMKVIGTWEIPAFETNTTYSGEL